METTHEEAKHNSEEDDEVIEAIKKEPNKMIQMRLLYMNQLNEDMNYGASNNYHQEYIDIRHRYEEKCFELYREISQIIKGTNVPELSAEEHSQYDIDQSKVANDELSKPIESFWLNALEQSDFFQLTHKDRGILIYLNDIQLNIDKDNKIDISISFFFDKNKYFTNEVLTKAYIYHDSNEKLYKSVPTPIDWIINEKPETKDLSFFRIFDESEQISPANEENEAYFFKNDLMQNLLKYYLDIDTHKNTLEDIGHLKSNLNYKMKPNK